MSAVFRVPEEVVSEVLDGEAVVLHLKTGKYFGLNASGTRMWELLGLHGDQEVTLQHLARDFQDADPAALRADLVAFIGELESRGLLERTAG